MFARHCWIAQQAFSVWARWERVQALPAPQAWPLGHLLPSAGDEVTRYVGLAAFQQDVT